MNLHRVTLTDDDRALLVEVLRVEASADGERLTFNAHLDVDRIDELIRVMTTWRRRLAALSQPNPVLISLGLIEELRDGGSWPPDTREHSLFTRILDGERSEVVG